MRPALELHDLFIGFLNFVFLGWPGILVIHDIFEAGARGPTEKFDFHAFVLLRFAVAVSLQVLHRPAEPGTGKITSHFSQHRTRRSFLIQVFTILVQAFSLGGVVQRATVGRSVFWWSLRPNYLCCSKTLNFVKLHHELLQCFGDIFVPKWP